MFKKLITSLLGGSKSDKDVKKIYPIVKEINEIYDTLHSLTDVQLSSKTDEFKAKIKSNSAKLEQEKLDLQTKLKEQALGAAETNELHDRIKKLDIEIFQTIEDTLDEILPEAFAVVKEVCRRLTESKHSYQYVDNHAIWEMIPYDVQLVGGVVIHQGKIAEMQTGEGKTLVAIMPMYLNALSGKGLHLVTVNDYLARRDCEWMKPVFDFLGISVGAIQANMDNQVRRELYLRDIVYGTNNEFGFDYLRDNMVIEAEQMVQRGHWFAIVDEVDSVLIDEARTPLIISGPVAKTVQTFNEMNVRVKRLVEAQSKLVNEMLKQATDKLALNTKEAKEEAGFLILRAHRGQPKHRRLVKFLQDTEIMRLLSKTELFYLQDQGRKMREVDEGLYFTIEEKNHQIDITEKGRELLCADEEDPEMFVMPDIAAQMSEIEGDSSLEEKEKQIKITEINRVFAERGDRIHTISQLLRAYSLYEKDNEYVVQDGKVMIVDEHTGRILDGRRYSDGLHQAIEAKEQVKVEKDSQTLATITLQNYYRLYNKLAGMTGTAETEAGEFEKIYSLEVVVIPTNRPMQRKDMNDLIFKTKREKYNAIIEDVKEQIKAGRPVLVGTASVEVSEVLSMMMRRQGIPHNVLNAKNHAREAEIVANAGKKGAVTIATNMAGRGTDIKINEEVKNNGGLTIIGSERHDSRRIDRQLRGRAGRQGDPGSSRFYISLEDNLIRLFGAGGEKMASIMERLKIPEGEAIEHSMVTSSVERAQKKVEENNFAIRKRLLDYDDVMNQQREVIYARRKQALMGERLKGELFEYIEDMAYDWFDEYKTNKTEPNVNEVKNLIRNILLCDLKMTDEEFASSTDNEFANKVVSIADEFYTRKDEVLGNDFMRQLEKVAVLQTIDEKWREHLRAMDDMKEGIHLRSYGQKDPLLEYKGEAFKMFVELIKDINKASVNFAFKYFPRMIERVHTEPTAQVAPSLKATATSNLSYERKDNTGAEVSARRAPVAQAPEGENASSVKAAPVRVENKIGRNDIVRVRYNDGKVTAAKFKKVEQDLENGLCQIVEN